MAVRRLGPRRRAGRGDVHPHRHRQAQRRRSVGLARRCPQPDRGDAADPARRTPPLELGSATEARSGRVGQIARGPLRSEPPADQNQIEHPRGLRRMHTQSLGLLRCNLGSGVRPAGRPPGGAGACTDRWRNPGGRPVGRPLLRPLGLANPPHPQRVQD